MNQTFDDKINWCGYEWECCMENNRIMHPDYPWYWMDKDQVSIENNQTLVLKIANKPNAIRYWDNKIYNPVIACGLIRSIKPFSYGTFSADIKLPHGYNLWPSFWLSGDTNWPPEIDIMEAWTYDDRPFRLFTSKFPYINPGWRTTTNVHYLEDTLSKKDCGSENISIFKQWKNPSNNFINYKVDWFPNEIIFYVNNKVVRRINNEISKDLTKNLNHPDKGFEMDVIFNVFCENPGVIKVNLNTPMIIKNFKYIPYSKE